MARVDPAQGLKRHPVIEPTGDLREVTRISAHLKIVTGTYIFQTNRVAFNQNQVCAIQVQ